jgi:hypothetical protein
MGRSNQMIATHQNQRGNPQESKSLEARKHPFTVTFRKDVAGWRHLGRLPKE